MQLFIIITITITATMAMEWEGKIKDSEIGQFVSKLPYGNYKYEIEGPNVFIAPTSECSWSEDDFFEELGRVRPYYMTALAYNTNERMFMTDDIRESREASADERTIKLTGLSEYKPNDTIKEKVKDMQIKQARAKPNYLYEAQLYQDDKDCTVGNDYKVGETDGPCQSYMSPFASAMILNPQIDDDIRGTCYPHHDCSGDVTRVLIGGHKQYCWKRKTYSYDTWYAQTNIIC